MSEAASERTGFLSTVPAARSDVRIVAFVLAASVVVFVAAAPFAKVQLAAAPAFLPAYQSALIITDLITAVLLLGQFGILRSRSLLVLATGYLFCALMAVAHAWSFPGLFAEAGLPGAGEQTTAWLYFLWHGGFPLFVIAYAVLQDRERAGGALVASPGVEGFYAAVALALIVLAQVLLTTAGHDALPRIMSGDLDSSTKIYVAGATWVLSLVALAVLWRRRQRTVLDLWLMVAMCVWAFDVALASVLNHGRFDVGWYAGRIYGLVAMSVVLMVLLIEHSLLYARVIAARESERRERQRAEEKAAELAAVNRELEAFSYSVSHDLRAPLRSIDGFTRVLQEDHSAGLDPEGLNCTERIRRAAQRMAVLIDDLLNLSRISRADLRRMNIDLSALAREIAATLKESEPQRDAEFAIADGMRASGDAGMLRIALENLLGNSWKFTAGRSPALIEIGQHETAGEVICYVRDNGAGFDMAYASKLFRAFQRLHDAKEFPGTGIGLAIVDRVMTKHGGRVWAEAESGKGATFFFTLSRVADRGAGWRVAA